MGRDACASCFPRRGEGGVEEVLVEHVWEVEEGDVGGLSVAALSSGAWCLVVVVILGV